MAFLDLMVQGWWRVGSVDSSAVCIQLKTQGCSVLIYGRSLCDLYVYGKGRKF